MEVCVDSVESAVQADLGGAKRLELCYGLSEGGLTPSIGLLTIVKSLVKCPVFVMIRPREGDFHYNEQELEVMKIDCTLLKEHGADGFVFGILNKDGSVDQESCQELIEICRPLPITFHRAIDVSNDLIKALDVLISLTFDRVLTSGSESSALEGVPMIRKMIERSNNFISVVPAGGITEKNLQQILDETGAKEFHSSASFYKISSMIHMNHNVTLSSSSLKSNDYNRKISNKDRVKTMVNIFHEC